MHKFRLLLIGSALCCAAVLLAQTLPSALPSVEHRSYFGGSSNHPRVARQSSCIGGREYLCFLEDSGVSADWQPPAPLPLGWAKVEEIARIELRKLVQDESKWLVTDFRLSRFERGPGWYYAITLKPEIELIALTSAIALVNERPQSYTLLVDFSGTPGKTGSLGTPKVQQ